MRLAKRLLQLSTPDRPRRKGTFQVAPPSRRCESKKAPPSTATSTTAWRQAKPAGEFLEKPGREYPHAQRTEFRVVYDDDAHNTSVWCFDTEAGRIVAHNMERDGHMRYEDVVNVTLDTFWIDETDTSFPSIQLVLAATAPLAITIL